jgi:hypothetical protein
MTSTIDEDFFAVGDLVTSVSFRKFNCFAELVSDSVSTLEWEMVIGAEEIEGMYDFHLHLLWNNIAPLAQLELESAESFFTRDFIWNPDEPGDSPFVVSGISGDGCVDEPATCQFRYVPRSGGAFAVRLEVEGRNDFRWGCLNPEEEDNHVYRYGPGTPYHIVCHFDSIAVVGYKMTPEQLIPIVRRRIYDCEVANIQPSDNNTIEGVLVKRPTLAT